jgi:hypothetical protein
MQANESYHLHELDVKHTRDPKSTVYLCLAPFETPERADGTKAARKMASKTGRQIHFVIQASFKPSSRAILGGLLLCSL